MKKNIVLVSAVGFLALAMGSTVADAQDSKSEINFEAGDQVTKPVNPLDPTNPVVPSPIDPTDPSNGGTNQNGPLSIDYVSNIKFGKQKISGKDMTYSALNAAPFVQVTDLRGAGEGWNLSAKISDFSSITNQLLKGATLSMKSSEVKAASTGNVTKAPVQSDITFDNKESKVVMNAANKSGRGTWVDVWAGTDQANEKVQLKVVAGTAEADTAYAATIIWELADAPK